MDFVVAVVVAAVAVILLLSSLLASGVSEGQYFSILTWCLGAIVPHTFWSYVLLSVAGIRSLWIALDWVGRAEDSFLPLCCGVPAHAS